MSHTTFRNSQLFCLNCGCSHKLQFPIPVDKMVDATKAFDTLHADCEKTWKEPEPNMDLSWEERANWWMEHGERGTSSEVMWRTFMGFTSDDVSAPSDPDDFKRCYKLLKTVPEWKENMHALEELSPYWKALVGSWDKLTLMYERNVSEDWKNHKEVGMYALMDKLAREAN